MGPSHSSQLKETREVHSNSEVLHQKLDASKDYSEAKMIFIQKLIFVFRRSSEFLSLQDSLNILCLNKYIRQHIVNSEWEMMMSIKICLEFLKENDEIKCVSTFQSYNINYHNLYQNFSKSENLLKNPCGELGFQHWSKKGDWRFSKKGTWKDKSRCFCTSYSWAKLSQEIEFNDVESRKILLVKSYVARRFDCESTARIALKGYENDSWSKLFETGEFLPPYSEVVKSPSCGWMNVHFAKVIDPGVIKLKVILAGKDNKFWSGYYGPRFGYTDIRIIDI